MIENRADEITIEIALDECAVAAVMGETIAQIESKIDAKAAHNQKRAARKAARRQAHQSTVSAISPAETEVVMLAATPVAATNNCEPLTGDAPAAKPVQRPTTAITTGDLADINIMLSELNLSEGDESLARGDRTNALRCYREAHNYAPHNVAIYLKLTELLSEQQSTMAEAKQLLIKGMRLAPDNDQLREKLAALLKPVHKKTRFRRLKRLYQSSTDLEQLPKHIKPISIALLLGIISLIGVIPLWSQHRQRVEIKPLTTQALLSDSKRLEFNWQSSTNTVNYLFQIEARGEIVLERYTRECNYVLSQADLQQLKPDNRYKWRVTPVTMRREPLPCKTVEAEFTLADHRQ